MEEEESDTLDELFRRDTPLIDVRAPVEFSRGAFPAAVNLPILDDAEREQVGLTYKESGPAAAVALGYKLVSGSRKADRINQWCAFVDAHPDCRLYCFRGGQRSQIACEWLAETGVSVPRIEGGYKRLRQHLLDLFESRIPDLFIVSGRTGTGKTGFISRFDNAIDLEANANHRGSAFGGRITPQPAQTDFENRVAIDFIKLSSRPEVLLEDESRLIGRMHLPPPLQEKMKRSPLLVIEESLETRTGNIFDEYIVQQWCEYESALGSDAPARFREYLLNAVDGIRKRLGNVAHQQIREIMVEACSHHETTGSPEHHRRWIRQLLEQYYDPMYNYQLENKSSRILMAGSTQEVEEWYRDRLKKLT